MVASAQSTATPSVQYYAHERDQGWGNFPSKDGARAGTEGKARAIEALKVSLANADGGIRHSAHCVNVGWQDWVSDGAIAGTTGWNYRAEAIEVRLVKHGEDAPSSTANAYIPSHYQTSIIQEGESTTARVRPDSRALLRADGVATDMRVTATMRYSNTVTRNVTDSTSLASIDAAGMALNVGTYGPFTAKVEHLKGDHEIGTTVQELGVTASEYNLAPPSATFPVVLYSISY